MAKKTKTTVLPVKYELTQLEENKGDPVLLTTKVVPAVCRVYRRRWPILILFMLFGLISSMSWIQYSIIANIVMRYYNVSSYAVDWTSLIFMLVYIPLIFPASYLVDKKGLRLSTLIGTLGTCVGSCIKVAAVAPDRFAVAFVGHTIVGMSQVFLLSLPPKLAAVWFGADQVSTACSLAVFGNQVGVAAGFLLPPLIIRNHENIEDIGHDMSIFSYGMAICATALFIGVVLIFKEAPPVPPSVAQLLQRESINDGFLKSIKRLAVNRGYLLLLLAYGINLGVFNAVSTLLNQLIMKYFADGEQFGGRVGLVLTICGMMCSVVAGIVLDKTHKFKETTLFLYVFSLVGMLAFSYVITTGSEIIVYLTSCLLGFCLGGFMPVGFELAMELTYPEPEGTSTGILMFVCQLVSFLFTLIYSLMIGAVGDFWANMALSGALFIGCVLIAMIPQEMRRQAATQTKVRADVVR